MRGFSPRVLATLLVALAFMAPQAALADQLNLAGRNAWDLYVYGNGEAIAQILTSLKLIMAPEAGGGAFRYLLLFLAMLGFVVLAVKAGFNPAQNFLRMFGFILLIWAVTYGTQYARANVHVYDRYTAYSNVITGVPALVAIPASVVSQTGEWLTRAVEQNFTIPGSLKVSEGGQFDLFGKVMSDMNKFVITDADLKRSVAAYVSDCVVSAMALAKISAKDLVASSHLVETLSRAQSPAIMTRYFPMTANSSGSGASQCPAVSGSGANAQLGAVMSCTQAFSCLEDDLANYGDALLEATNRQWQTAGVMVPFEQAMSDALAQAGASGSANPLSRYSRPQGIILQKALQSSMVGAFRNAAVRTGNNEIMMATSVAQAEQSQKTAWWTAGELFKNMMGYVYVVLQAFIFAIVPIVVIGLMIPGLGGKIFINYCQILVWLTLWMPMLAIVSFLITLFGGAQLRETLAVSGLSMENSAVVTEHTNNLVIAAQFLGTMVPLITWGLVKGTMAFTEFITHGIGSSFAASAGAQAATGNVSMGNLSMDNVGLGKYSTVMTSAVGQQQVQATFGAGHSLAEMQSGGAMASASGVNESVSRTRSDKASITDSQGQSVTMGRDQARSYVAEQKQSVSGVRDLVNKASELLSMSQSSSDSQGTSSSWSKSDRAAVSEAATKAVDAVRSLSSEVSAGARGGFGSGGLKFGVEAGYEIASQKTKAERALNDWRTAVEHANQHSQDAKHSLDSTTSSASQHGSGNDTSFRRSLDHSRATLEAASQSAKHAESWVDGLTVSEDKSVITSHTEAISASGFTGARPVDVEGAIESGRAGLAQGQSSFAQSTSAATAAAVATARTNIAGEIHSSRATITQEADQLTSRATTVSSGATAATVSQETALLKSEFGAAHGQAVEAQKKAREKTAELVFVNPISSPLQ